MKKQAWARGVMGTSGWLAISLDAPLDNEKIDWESDGVLKAHEPMDQRIQSNTGKRKEGGTSMDLYPLSQARDQSGSALNVPQVVSPRNVGNVAWGFHGESVRRRRG